MQWMWFTQRNKREQPSEQQTCQQVHECLNKHTEQCEDIIASD